MFVHFRRCCCARRATCVYLPDINAGASTRFEPTVGNQSIDGLQYGIARDTEVLRESTGRCESFALGQRPAEDQLADAPVQFFVNGKFRIGIGQTDQCAGNFR